MALYDLPSSSPPISPGRRRLHLEPAVPVGANPGPGTSAHILFFNRQRSAFGGPLPPGGCSSLIRSLRSRSCCPPDPLVVGHLLRKLVPPHPVAHLGPELPFEGLGDPVRVLTQGPRLGHGI